MDQEYSLSPELLKTLQTKQETFFSKEALELYIPPQVGRFVGDGEPKDAAQVIGDWLNHSDKQCLLLLGDSGAGKTLFGQWLTQQFFQNQGLEGRISLSISLFAHLDKQCLLLLGDSGAGKTLFGQWFTRQSFHYQGLQVRIPLFIPLLAQKYPNGRLLEDYLKITCKIKDKSQREWIKQQPLLLILDGFDEMHQKINLYQSNKLWKLKDVKILISCRSQALAHVHDYASLFCPCDSRGKLQTFQLEKYVVTPFSEKQIEAYLKKYIQTRTHRIESIVKQTENSSGLLEQNWGVFTTQEITRNFLEHLDEKSLLNAGQVSKGWRYYSRLQKQVKDSAKWMHWETYHSYIQKLPGLQRLLSSPFVLSLVVQVLPSMIEQHQDKENITQLQLARINLYDHFIEQWFARQKKKLVDAGHISEDCPIEEAFTEYSKVLAHTLLQKGVTSVEYIPKTTTPLLKGQGIFSSPSSESTTNNDDDPWAKFFIEKNCPVGNEEIKLSLIRAGCPLMKLGDNQYAFLHKSLLEYFAARKLFEGAMNNASIALGYELNEKLLLDEPATLNFLAERVEQDDKLKECLFDVLEESKYEERVQVAAANAITILNHANVSFSQRDLSHIRVSGADLSNAILDSTDLREADLRGVNLQGAWLNNAKLGGALMEDIQFGEFPYLQGENAICCIAYSPDGHYLASGCSRADGIWGSSGDIQLWEVATGKWITTLKGHNNTLNGLAFSPDGKMLASGGGGFGGSKDNTVRLWDVESHKQVAEIEGHTSSVESVAFSPDGKILASGSGDYTVRLWDIESHQQVAEMKHTQAVESIAFSPDGKTLASGSLDSTVRLWDVESHKHVAEMQGHTYFVKSVTFSPDGKTLASGSADKTVRLWDVKNRKQIAEMKGHTHVVESVTFSPDGKTLASGSVDNTVCLWDVVSHKPVAEMNGHTKNVVCVAFSPDGKSLASGSWDKTIRLWDVESHKKTSEIKEHTDWAKGAALSPDGKTAALGRRDGAVQLWDVQSYKQVAEMKGHRHKINSVAFSLDGKILASGSADRTVRLWDIESHQQVAEMKHTLSVESVAFSLDGKILASGSADCTVRLWDVESHQQVAEMKGHTSSVTGVAFSPDGRLLASGNGDHFCDYSVHLWDIKTGECVNSHKFKFAVESLAFKKVDEKMHLCIGSGKAIYTFEIKSNQSKPEFILLWSVGRDTGLTCDQMDMGGAVVALDDEKNPLGMDASNERLLRQRGAVGKLSQKKTADVLEARRHRIPYNPNQPPYNLFSGQYLINPGWAVVSMVRKKAGKGSEHVFLVIETIGESNYCDYYTLTRADFFLDQRQEHSKGVIFSSGQALIEICTKPLPEMKLLAQHCVYKCWNISAHQAYILLQKLEADRLKYIAYLNSGNGALYSGVEPGAEKHNCLTWCEEHLTQIGVDVSEQQSWLDAIVVHPDFHLPVNNHAPHSEEKCLMM
jgi:WD40 repeat protein/tRNA A37 threonylcarbamoyladenosine biosynthesis protein TsaE